MASIVPSMRGRTKPYEPSPRWGHYAVPVRGRCFLWGGRVPNFSASGRKKLASTVEIFDPYLEIWDRQDTSGVSPPGLGRGACASLLNRLYSFGGGDDASFYNSLHTLDPTFLEWKELRVLSQTDVPMSKAGCGIVPYGQDRLALFGGYGILTGCTQPGATFAKNASYTDGRGWTNELHIFNVNAGKWSIPTTSGPRPPPCANFTFTAITDHLAVLFGGFQPGCGGREWTKLERPEGVSWPVGRSSHAACCLNHGQDHPQVLVTGGKDSNGKVLNDMWILDVKSGKWRELTLREGAQPRMYHTITAFSLGPGRTQVTMFGGCPKWDWGKSEDAQLKLAETTVLEFESVETLSSGGVPPTVEWVLASVAAILLPFLFPSLFTLSPLSSLLSESVETPSSGGVPPTVEWVLASVAGSRQLGSNKRIKKKVANMCCVILEFEANRKALREAYSQQGVDRRVQDAEARAQDFQMLLGASQDACRESQQSLQETQKSLQESQQSLQESQQSLQESQQSLQESQDEIRNLQLQLQASQDAFHESQQSLQASRAEKQNLQQSAHVQTEILLRRVQDAERRAEEAERRAHDALQGASESEPTWLVQWNEINLTDTELGRGAWAVVRIAEFRGVHCAAKCLYRQIVSDYNQHSFIREINMAARLRHPNLLQFIGATLEGQLIILTELMPTSVRGELENRRTFSDSQINLISLDVARALNYLHQMQPSPIIHRDISSANVLLEPGPSNSWKAKVSDYGSVNLLERLRTVAPGNPTYAAPEAQNVALQSPKMDIFSFGVLLVEMCSTRFPEVADRERFIHSIRHPGMVRLIRWCLAVDKNARPSACEIITELSQYIDYIPPKLFA